MSSRSPLCPNAVLKLRPAVPKCIALGAVPHSDVARNARLRSGAAETSTSRSSFRSFPLPVRYLFDRGIPVSASLVHVVVVASTSCPPTTLAAFAGTLNVLVAVWQAHGQANQQEAAQPHRPPQSVGRAPRSAETSRRDVSPVSSSPPLRPPPSASSRSTRRLPSPTSSPEGTFTVVVWTSLVVLAEADRPSIVPAAPSPLPKLGPDERTSLCPALSSFFLSMGPESVVFSGPVCLLEGSAVDNNASAVSASCFLSTGVIIAVADVAVRQTTLESRSLGSLLSSWSVEVTSTVVVFEKWQRHEHSNQHW